MERPLCSVNPVPKKKITTLEFKNMRYGTDFQTEEEMEAFEAKIAKRFEYNLMDGVLGCVK